MSFIPGSNYVKGVIANFPGKLIYFYIMQFVIILFIISVEVKPFRAIINCNLSSGSGLSSSAALETATLLLLQELLDYKIDG